MQRLSVALNIVGIAASLFSLFVMPNPVTLLFISAYALAIGCIYKAQSKSIVTATYILNGVLAAIGALVVVVVVFQGGHSALARLTEGLLFGLIFVAAPLLSIKVLRKKYATVDS